MIAHEITMVSGKDHDGVLGQPKGMQFSEHPADRIVDETDRTVVECNRLARLAFGAGKERLRILHRSAIGSSIVQPAHVRWQVAMLGMKRGWRTHFIGGIHRPVLTGRRIRMMRIGERAIHEKRLLAIGRLAQPVDGTIGNPGGRIK